MSPPAPASGDGEEHNPDANAEANLGDFGMSLGQRLQFDESGTCVLEIDARYTVLISYDRETERLYLYSSLLTNIPAEPSVRLHLFETMLEGALLGRDMAGGGVGLSVKNDFILLGTSLPMRVCGSAALRLTMPTFVDALRRWRRKVRELLTGMSHTRTQSPISIPDIESERGVAEFSPQVSYPPPAPTPQMQQSGGNQAEEVPAEVPVAIIGVEVTDGVPAGLQPPEDAAGVVVVGVKGAAQRDGLREHDLITSVNGHRVRTLQDFQAITQTLEPEVAAQFVIERSGTQSAIAVTPQRGVRRVTTEARRYRMADLPGQMPVTAP